jgi:hypothetical protein
MLILCNGNIFFIFIRVFFSSSSDFIYSKWMMMSKSYTQKTPYIRVDFMVVNGSGINGMSFRFFFVEFFIFPKWNCAISFRWIYAQEFVGNLVISHRLEPMGMRETNMHGEITFDVG